ncbi:MAG TPA: alpha/beta hydrolase-fold protein [Candidatus Baltobacteraceae bacterium]|jgi:enterochelin esterase family protein|nr:alpha/beta hydrolase-fold protein [Candidatus Baltobacteraceae bacterium]
MATNVSPHARLLGLHGDLHIDFVKSRALEGNALGDPAERPVIVYTPARYDANGSTRYPVLYCLHGYTGDAAALIAARPWETNVVQWIDRLILAGRMQPALLVIVDGFTRLGGSQYVNSVHNGNYATYVIEDVVGHVDRSYRTLAREAGRAVLGKSSGGFGSLYLTMTYPGTFAAFACHSGDSYFWYAQPRGFVDAHRTLERHGWNIAAFVEDFESKPKRQPAEYTTMEMLAYTAAYSPRSAAAFDLELPFDRETGALRDEVFARWLAFDPAEMCLRKQAELARLRLRYLDCGRRDEYGLDVGARLLAQRMRAMGLSVTHEEFDDDHRNVGYRYEISLPALAGVLEHE